MYEGFYGLDQRPFHITPDPSFLYMSPSHKEALASIIYGVDQRKGFVVVTGEVGLGKTTILRSYLELRNRNEITPVYIFDANVSFKGLLKAVYRELGIRPTGDDVATLVDGLHHVLIEAYRLGRTVVLIIDEAQNTPVETLEQLRSLSNLETATDKLLQVILVGQSELAATLNLHELRQLKQRVAVRCTLLPLTTAESRAYIEHRLNKAGGSSSSVFTPQALRRIVRHARGIPRALNIVCDAALVTAFGHGRSQVTAGIVKEVIGDLNGGTRRGRLRWLLGSATAVLLVGVALAFLGRRDVASFTAESTVPVARPVATSSDRNVRAPVVSAAADAWPVSIRIVRPGEGLFQMAKEEYGFASAAVIERIMRTNPGIRDPNVIQMGSSITFPPVSDLAPPSQDHR